MNWSILKRELNDFFNPLILPGYPTRLFTDECMFCKKKPNKTSNCCDEHDNSIIKKPKERSN